MAGTYDSEQQRMIDRIRCIAFREARDAGATFINRQWIAEKVHRTTRFVTEWWEKSYDQCFADYSNSGPKLKLSQASRDTILNASVPKCQLNFKATAQKPIEYKSGSRAVAMNDFNSDTWLDIVVANYYAENIAIYFGHGDGTITSPIKISTGKGSAPYMVAVGDFDNDHRPDIAIANFGTNSIGIFLGFQNESFSNQTFVSTESSRP
ncbi:unnamed protein product, partial [Rotaria sp. Silwood1]